MCHYEWIIDPVETTYDQKADIDTSLVFTAPNGDDLELRLSIHASEHAFYECTEQETMDVCNYYLSLLSDLEGGDVSVNKCQTKISEIGE